MPKSEATFEVGSRVPSFRSEVGSRLREVEKSFKNRATVAAVCGVSKSTFQNWVEGRADPSFEGLSRLSAETGISLDWLATGRGEMRAAARREAVLLGGLADGDQAAFESDAGFVLVPRYNVEASAGPGALNGHEHVVDHMAFRADFVRRVLRADPDHLALIMAVGDSMEPSIRAGDLLLIDRSVDRIMDDAIYILGMGDELVVKRVQRFFDGGLVVKSDNIAYREQTITPEAAPNLRVAGRVRWIGRLI
ncbi:LexA family transcriptional regulator [Shumkonia mesophila]|uniref:LexA family transcriptional regulator n=1 Tax=Shumkonia mesophila TaxID=2838854 RepID=UPI0029345E1B|nr:helix-turn-helix transcriptional regulator [Shumkonia mesophila]